MINDVDHVSTACSVTFFKRKNGLCLYDLIYSNLDEGMFV